MVNNNASVPTPRTPALPAPAPLLALQDGKLEDSQESQTATTPSSALQPEELKVQVTKAEMKQQALKPVGLQKPKRNINEVLGDLKKAFVQDNAQRKERRLEEVEAPEQPASSSKDDNKQKNAGKENTKPKEKPKVLEKKVKKESVSLKEEKKKKEALPSLKDGKKKTGKTDKDIKEKTEEEPKLKMDRKCFTSRAYHRAYKEHLKKTGDKEEAKLVAQQALREASKQWEEEFKDK